jgi:two-component system CheB/CheR fusion protein
MSELIPDHAEEALADLIDNVVPTHGYRLTPMVGLGGSAGAISARSRTAASRSSRTRST